MIVFVRPVAHQNPARTADDIQAPGGQVGHGTGSLYLAASISARMSEARQAVVCGESLTPVG
jgi:hypothetical protein